MAYKERQTRLFTSLQPLSTTPLASPFDPSEEALLNNSDTSPITCHGVDSSFTRRLSLNDEISMYSLTPNSQPTTAYRKIGAGACGAVFARGGNSQDIAIKLAKVSKNTELWNDYVRHLMTSKQFRRFHFNEVSVPECYFFVPKDKTSESYFAHNPDLAKSRPSQSRPRSLPHPHQRPRHRADPLTLPWHPPLPHR